MHYKLIDISVTSAERPINMDHQNKKNQTNFEPSEIFNMSHLNASLIFNPNKSLVLNETISKEKITDNTLSNH